MSINITESDVQKVLDAYPTLRDHGFPTRGIKDCDAIRIPTGIANEQAFILAVAVMSTAPKTKKRTVSIYGCKHYVDDIVGYTSNGEFKIACALAGFGIDIVPGSPNGLIGVSRSWVAAQFSRKNHRVAA